MGCSSSTGVAAPTTKLSSAAPTPRRSKYEFGQCYAIGSKLGEGSFAEVFAARSVRRRNSQPDASGQGATSTQKLAVKVVDLRSWEPNPSDTPTQTIELQQQALSRRKQIDREIDVWSSLGVSDNIVNLVEVFFDGSICQLVMERCACSLQAMLTASPLDCEDDAGRIMWEMMAGIGHLHAAQVVHCDVKPDNYLVSADGQTVKLCDFGLSRLAAPRRGKLDCTAGTAPFMSPEMLNKQGFDFKTDIWSCGVTAYLFIFGAWPYAPKERSPENMKAAIRKGTPGPSFIKEPNCRTCTLESTASLVKVVKTLLTRDPAERPSADEIMESDDFVSGGMQRSKERSMQRVTSRGSLGSSRSGMGSLNSLDSRTGAKTARGISLDRLEKPRQVAGHNKHSIEAICSQEDTTCGTNSPSTSTSDGWMASTSRKASKEICSSRRPSKDRDCQSAGRREHNQLAGA